MSSAGTAIRNDNGEIRAFESKFERKIGDILQLDGSIFKVVSIEQNKVYAMRKIAMFKSTLFKFHKF